MKLLFGIPESRVRAIAARHTGTLALMHVGAIRPLALDDDVSPEELVAVVKFQLVAGLAAMVATEARPGGFSSLIGEIQQIGDLLTAELGLA